MPAPLLGPRARAAWLVLTIAACAGGTAARDDTGQAVQRVVPDTWKIVQVGDFNADGLADVLWTDPADGRIAVWLLEGRRVLEAGPEIPGPSSAGWAPVTAVDMTLDGMDDAPWARTDGSELAVWTLRGTHVATRSPPVPGPAGTGWAAVMGGDLDGDGMGDILWYDEAQHRIQAWLTRGTGVFAPGPELPGPPGDGWTVPTIGDFDGDGMGDILWFNTRTHRIAVWLMAGGDLLAPGPEIDGPVGPDWLAITGADFNHDGFTDVLWNDPTENRMAVWLMAGTGVLEAGPAIVGPAGGGWTVGSAGDTDGDGLADAVWENVGAHLLSVWTMNGTRVREAGPPLPGPR